MGAHLQLEGDEGGDPMRQRTDDSNSEESVVSDSSDENRIGVRYKGQSTNNVGATQELYKGSDSITQRPILTVRTIEKPNSRSN